MNLKLIQKNIVFFSSGEIISRILNFITFILIARIIVVEDFGAMNISIVIVSYFTIALGFIHDDIATREISSGILNEKSFCDSVFTLRLIIGISLYLLIVFMYFIIDLSGQIKSYVLIYGITIISNALYTNWYIRAKEKYNLISICMILSSLTNLICVLLFIHEKNDSITAVWIITLKEILNSLFLLIYYRKAIGVHFAFKIHTIKYLLNQSIPLALTALLLIANSNISLILICIISGNKEAGYFSAASKFVLISFIPFSIIYQSFLPQLSKNVNSLSYSDIVNKYSKYLIGIGFIITLTGFLFSDEIIYFTYGSHYFYSIPLLKILMISVLINYFSRIYSGVFITTGKQKLFLLSIFFGVIINVIVNLILIPKYASLGAVFSSVLSEVFILLFLAIFYKTHFNAGFLPLSKR